MTKLNKELKIYYQNMSGMTSHLTQIHRILENCLYDVVILTETWLSEHHLDLEIASSSWQITRLDRPGTGLGGGVLIAVKSSLPCSIIKLNTIGQDIISFQQCWVKIILENKDVYIGCFYMKPRQNPEHYFDYINLTKTLLTEMKADDLYFVFGDYNFPGIKWEENEDNDRIFDPSNITEELQEKVLQFFAEFGFGQICNLQNQAGNVLDLVFTNAMDDFELMEIDSIFNKNSIHHKSFEVKFLYAFNKLSGTSSSSIIYDFKNADYASISQTLQTFAIDPTLSIDEAADLFIETMTTTMDMFIPKKMITLKNKAPWHDSTYFRLKNRRNREYERWRKLNSEHQKLNFLQAREELEYYDKRAYDQYLCNSANQIKHNPKYFWKCVNYKRETNGYPSSMSYNNMFKHDSKDICNFFKDFFQTVYEEPEAIDPDNFNDIATNDQILENLIIDRETLLYELKHLDITKGPGPDGISTTYIRNVADQIVDPLLIILNRSLNEGYFPKNWKTSNITPIFKSGDRSKVENYRGIAILSIIPKLFEKIVTDVIVRFLDGKINEHQHGFRKKCSTTTNLVYYVSALLTTMETNKQVDAVYTDFSKAFDKVNHEILAIKLSKIGIKGSLLAWLKSYLSKRTQRVKLNGFISDPVMATSGVPQGSHLGPILFNIFINDLTTNISYCKYVLYADDMKIFGIVNQESDSVFIQNDIDRIKQWCNNNLMFLNVAKCNVITFSRKNMVINTNYNIENESLKRVPTINDLGVTLDAKLDFKCHIEKMTNCGYRNLGFVKRQSKEFSDPYVTKSLYCSLVRSKLEYASVVWNMVGITESARIESVQKQFLLFALRNLGWRRDTYVLPSYESRLLLLNMHTLEKRRNVNDIVFAYDLIKKNIKCPQLCNQIVLNQPAPQNLRRRRFLFVRHHTRHYTFNEPISRVSRAFNEVSQLYENSISRRCFKNKLTK